MATRIALFFEESKQELRRVHWPSREETVRYTLFVIGFSVAIAIFLGILDYLFVTVLETAIF